MHITPLENRVHTWKFIAEENNASDEEIIRWIVANLTVGMQFVLKKSRQTPSLASYLPETFKLYFERPRRGAGWPAASSNPPLEICFPATYAEELAHFVFAAIDHANSATFEGIQNNGAVFSATCGECLNRFRRSYSNN